MSILSDNLKKARKAKDLSQDKAAKLVGIPRPRLASYEQDRAVPPITILPRLITAYEIVDWRLFISSDHWAPGKVSDRTPSLIEQRYASLSGKEKTLADILLNLA